MKPPSLPAHKGWEKSRALRTALAVLVVLGVVLLLFCSGSLRALDCYWLDYLVRNYSPVRGIDSRIVLVGMSEKSLEALGLKRPVPRAFYARFLEKLTGRLGARAVGVDMFFAPSMYPAGDRKILEVTRKAGNIVYIAKPLGVMDPSGRREISEPLSGKLDHRRFLLGHPEFILEYGLVRHFDATVAGPDWECPALALMVLSCSERQPLRRYESDPPGGARPWYAPGGRTFGLGGRLYHARGNVLSIGY